MVDSYAHPNLFPVIAGLDPAIHGAF